MNHTREKGVTMMITYHYHYIHHHDHFGYHWRILLLFPIHGGIWTAQNQLIASLVQHLNECIRLEGEHKLFVTSDCDSETIKREWNSGLSLERKELFRIRDQTRVRVPFDQESFWQLSIASHLLVTSETFFDHNLLTCDTFQDSKNWVVKNGKVRRNVNQLIVHQTNSSLSVSQVAKKKFSPLLCSLPSWMILLPLTCTLVSSVLVTPILMTIHTTGDRYKCHTIYPRLEEDSSTRQTTSQLYAEKGANTILEDRPWSRHGTCGTTQQIQYVYKYVRRIGSKFVFVLFVASKEGWNIKQVKSKRSNLYASKRRRWNHSLFPLTMITPLLWWWSFGHKHKALFEYPIQDPSSKKYQ